MKYITNLFIIFVFLTFSGCKSNEEELVNKYFFEMGTIVHVAIEAGKEEEYYKIVAFIKELTNKINNDQIKIGESRAGSKVSVSDEFIELYQYASKYYKMSNGIYDPTSITVSREYGFPDKPLSMPSQEALDKAKKAMEIYEKVLRTYSDAYLAYYKVALSDKTKEMIYLKKALAINMNFTDAWIDLGRVELERHNFNESKKYLAVANYIDENNFRYYYYQGLVCKNQGLKSEAVNNFKKSLLLNPDFQPAKEELSI